MWTISLHSVYKGSMSKLQQSHSYASKRNFIAWFIWGLAAAYFFSDYLARVSPGVMSHLLQMDFHASAAGLGLLSSFFYYPYILMQIPVGLMVDRYSIRRLLTTMALITAIGCYIFGVAPNLWVAALGRALIGFSAAFAMVSALKLAATWFPPERLGLLAGLTQALGMWGAAFGEAPVSFVMEQVGWRNTMYYMALMFLLLSILILKFVQDSPIDKKSSLTHRTIKPQKIKKSLSIILLNPQTWIAAFYAGFIFAPTAVLAEFWGPSYLQYGRGLSQHAAAFANGLIFIGWGVGGPIAGWLSDKMGMRKPLMYFSAISGTALLFAIFYLPHLSQLTIFVLFFIYGATNIGVVIAYAVATEINPKKTVGASIAFANMGSIMIGAILQPIFGKVIEVSLGHKVIDISLLKHGDFFTAVSLLPLCSIIALILAYFLKETYCHSFDTQN